MRPLRCLPAWLLCSPHATLLQGKWKGIGIITSVITLGVLVVYIGVSTSSYTLTLFGRVLYGLGGESVYVGVDILVTKWFAGEHAARRPRCRYCCRRTTTCTGR